MRRNGNYTQITLLRSFLSAKKKKMKVMYIVQFYTNGWTEFDAMISDIVAMDWQLRLLSYLTENDHTVLVKQHPNSEIRMPDHFFETSKVINVEGRFEDVYQQADIILTDYSGSTTFGAALKSKKPVIFVDFGYSQLLAKEYELLQKSCYVIKGKFLEDNRVDINWNDLKAGLVECLKLNHDDYVSKNL